MRAGPFSNPAEWGGIRSWRQLCYICFWSAFWQWAYTPYTVGDDRHREGEEGKRAGTDRQGKARRKRKVNRNTINLKTTNLTCTTERERKREEENNRKKKSTSRARRGGERMKKQHSSEVGEADDCTTKCVRKSLIKGVNQKSPRVFVKAENYQSPSLPLYLTNMVQMRSQSLQASRERFSSAPAVSERIRPM